jgi:hypothetical protein
VRGRLQILEPAVGAAADEHHVDRLAQHGLAAVKSHVAQRLVEDRVALAESGMEPPMGTTMPGLVP